MIYPKDEMIERLLEGAADQETGEMLLTEEELAEQISALEMAFDDKIKALRNSYMSDMMDAKCIEAEASALYEIQQETSKRAKTVKNKAERTKRFIAWLLNGEKFDKDGVKISYITRDNAVIDDGFIDWAKSHAPGFLNEPTVRKTDLASALKAGKQIDFARLEQKKYIQIK